MSALLRTVVFTIVVPGIVAVLIPYYLLPQGAHWSRGAAGIFAVVLVAVGTVIYVWCAFWAFAWTGGGTPAPFDPPKRLVAHGPYRIVRNPMYVGVGTVLLAEAIGFHSLDLAIYLVIWGACVHLFVLFYEEPTLGKKFGHEYEEYCRQVSRWWPRVS